MTDGNKKHGLSQIELGKWFSNAQYYYRPRNDKERNLMRSCYEEGYNNGYEQGKPKWHDLRKDPNDLPKERGEYLILHEDNTGFTHYSIRDFRNGYFECTNTILAWCELPKFEE